IVGTWRPDHYGAGAPPPRQETVAMDNYEVAKVLDETGNMLEVAGENFFRVRAYRNAARSIRDLTAQIADLSEEQIDEIPGIGADLAKKITAITKTGDMPVHHELASKFPPQLLELKDVPGLGPKRLKLLIDRLHIRDRDDLEKAVRTEAPRKMRGHPGIRAGGQLSSAAGDHWRSRRGCRCCRLRHGHGAFHRFPRHHQGNRLGRDQDERGPQRRSASGPARRTREEFRRGARLLHRIQIPQRTSATYR